MLRKCKFCDEDGIARGLRIGQSVVKPAWKDRAPGGRSWSSPTSQPARTREHEDGQLHEVEQRGAAIGQTLRETLQLEKIRVTVRKNLGQTPG